MTTMTEIEKTIFSLPPDERASLAHRILDSLEGFSNDEIENLWLDEAHGRWQDIQGGKISCIPSEQVMERARAALKK